MPSQLALQFSQGGGYFNDAWHPLLEHPLMMKCIRALQPELMKPREEHKAVLDAISDYLLEQDSVRLPDRLARYLNEDLADTLGGMKRLMKKKDLQALQHTLNEKKARAGKALERLLREDEEPGDQ